MLSLLNEICARRAKDELRAAAGTEAPAMMAFARKRVGEFLGISEASAPMTESLEESEPQLQAVREACCGDYDLDASKFDFKQWVKDTLDPWIPVLQFVHG